MLFLDGIRGWASLMVLMSHLAVFFLANSLPEFQGWIFGFLSDGNLAVFIFLVLSGFALSIGYFQTGKVSVISALAIRRYPRLAIPIFFSCFFAYLLLASGLFYNAQAGRLANNAWLTGFYGFAPDFVRCAKFALYDVFTAYDGSVSYDAVLWTMPIELWGSFAVFAICAVIGHLRKRALLLAAIVVYLVAANSIWYLPFACGIGIAMFHHWPDARPKRYVAYAAPAIIAFVIYYSSSTLRGGIFGLPAMPRTDILNILAACGIVLVAACTPWLRRFFENRVSRYLGSISFPLYLTHFLVLCSLSSFLLIKLETLVADRHAGHLINFAISAIACIAVAHMFRRIETLAIASARRFSKRLLEQDDDQHNEAFGLRSLKAMSQRAK